MRIGIDVDGVICDLYKEIILRMEKAGIDKQSPGLHMEFEISYPHVPKEWFAEQFNDSTLWENANAYELNWYTVNRWARGGNEIYFISSRPMNLFGVTTDWLDRWSFDYHQLYCGVEIGKKFEKVKELGLNIFIDDHPIEAVAAAKDCQAFLQSRAYNGRYKLPTRVRRIDSLSQIKGINVDQI